MPIDPVAAAVLQQLVDAGAPALNELSVPEARLAFQGFRAMAGEAEAVGAVVDQELSGPSGPLGVRVYTPAVAGNGPLPCIVYYHGGGWVLGDLEVHDPICRVLANRAGCRLVAVDYRLAPEHKFPAALDDCYAAFAWVVQNADLIGVDPDRVAVVGDSSGGNLAAAVSLLARDQEGPAPRCQVLVYPVTNHAYDTESYEANGDRFLLTRDLMVWFWNHYLSAPEEGDNPLASPLAAADLSGLPPAFIVTGEFDPLRDEAEAYALRLSEAGTPASYKRYDGQIHGFWQLPGVFPAARQAVDDVVAQLQAAFA